MTARSHIIPFLILITTSMISNILGKTQTETCHDHYVKRFNFEAPLEPIEGVLHGAGQDVGSYKDYRTLMGPSASPQVYMTYIGLTNPRNAKAWCDRIQEEMISLNKSVGFLQVGVNMTGGNDTGQSEVEEVANGVHDDSIRLFLDTLEELNMPVFLRIGYEFEGSWNNYKPEAFQKAWIRITRMVRQRSFSAATVWCSAGQSAGPVPFTRLMEFYPGDEWVDWWGQDVFEAEECLSDWTMEFMDLARKHQKPVMLGECTPRYVGVLDGQKSWDKWFEGFFELIRTRPEIKAFCYINWDWYYWSEQLGFQWHDWLDARLQSNKIVGDLYRREMELPLYLHSEEK